MKRLLLIAILLSGCAVRFTTNPTEGDICILYCRITNCTAQDAPTPLPDSPSSGTTPMLKVEPKGPNDQSGGMTATGGATHCHTTEVGAKSYSDTIVAIGMAFAGIYAKIHGLF